MKKVVCPACGLVNLEKFVTYPHCAACGASLLDAPDERVSRWKKPISAPLWATLIGLCCAGLGIAGLVATRETQPDVENQLVIYVQTPRRLRVGEVGTLKLGVDSVEESGAVSNLEDLQLRLPRTTLQDFKVGVISPPPQTQTWRRNGLYLAFGSVPRGQYLSIELKARRAGRRRLAFSLYAHDFPRLQWDGSVQVGPKIAAKPLPKGAAKTAPRAALNAAATAATRQTKAQ